VPKYPEKFTKAHFIVPINWEYGAPVGSDAGGTHLKIELDIEVLPTAECTYIFCPGPPKQSRKITMVWPDHRVTSEPPVVARCKVQRRLLPLDWDFLAPPGTIQGASRRIWMRARSIVAQRAAE
jgi:hypothetical protein